MKERVFAAVREMKREQWLICGLAGFLLLVIAAPVKQKEQTPRLLLKTSIFIPVPDKFPDISENLILALFSEHSQQLFQHIGGLGVYRPGGFA